MSFKLMYLRSLTQKAIQNIHDLNLLRRAQNDLVLNRSSSGFMNDKSSLPPTSPPHQTNFAKRSAAQMDEEDQGPVRYSTSRAAKFRAAENFRMVDDKYPASQRWVINTSLVLFMIYFFILREENDLDKDLGKSLFDRFPQMERPILENAIVNNERAGQSTDDIRKRLQELDSQET